MGLSQEHVARMIGLRDATQLSRYESGSILPSLEMALKISIFYQTSLAQLFPELHSQAVSEIVEHPRSTVVPRGRAYLNPVMEVT